MHIQREMGAVNRDIVIERRPGFPELRTGAGQRLGAVPRTNPVVNDQEIDAPLGGGAQR